MTTQVGVDAALVEAAVRLGGHASPEEAVAAALAEYVRHRSHVDPLDRFESVDCEFNDDHPRPPHPPRD